MICLLYLPLIKTKRFRSKKQKNTSYQGEKRQFSLIFFIAEFGFRALTKCSTMPLFKIQKYK